MFQKENSLITEDDDLVVQDPDDSHSSPYENRIINRTKTELYQSFYTN
jgi:hypothetical protein